jgi:hypothetical protein
MCFILQNTLMVLYYNSLIYRDVFHINFFIIFSNVNELSKTIISFVSKCNVTYVCVSQAAK